jgi:hypothetical protein
MLPLEFHSIFNALEIKCAGFHRDETHLLSPLIFSLLCHHFSWYIISLNDNETPMNKLLMLVALFPMCSDTWLTEAINCAFITKWNKASLSGSFMWVSFVFNRLPHRRFWCTCKLQTVEKTLDIKYGIKDSWPYLDLIAVVVTHRNT